MFSRTVRIFVSSTFKDMKFERRILHSPEVRGRLRDHCVARGFQFQIIDLRWGVPEEAAWDQRTEDLCLDEIRRCQRLSPRPNFLALVGQRYGWRPLPSKLTRADWGAIEQVADAPSLDLARRWYELDRNSVPEIYCLRPRQSKTERDATFWRDEVEGPLRSLLRGAAEQAPSTVSDALTNCDLSLTEKEIRLAGEHANEDGWQAFVWFRELTDAPRDTLPEPWVDRDRNGRMADPRSGAKLADLYTELDGSDKFRVRRETVAIADLVEGSDYATTLQGQMFDDLLRAIEERIAEFEATAPLEREVQDHLDFAESRARNYVRRTGTERRVVEQLANAVPRPLVLAGPSGAGKSAMMATISRDLRERFPDAIHVTRFVGATGNASSLRPLITSIHEEIAKNSGTASGPIATDPGVAMQRALAAATADRPIFVVVDALDQLDVDDDARTGSWLPRELPPHARVLVSCLARDDVEQDGDQVLGYLQGRLDPASFERLAPPDSTELAEMLRAWLASFGRRLSQTQTRAVEAGIDKCPRPLYLRVVVEMAREWGAEASPPPLPATIEEAIDAQISRLAGAGGHGEPMVASVLGNLAASRAGLTETELIDLLDRDAAVVEPVQERSRRYGLPSTQSHLPPAVWSRLLADLDLFLGDGNAAGISLITFYHRQLAYVANKRYLTPERSTAVHARLADYFQELPLRIPGSATAANVRRAYELAYQLRLLKPGEGSPRLQTELASPDPVSAKIDAGLGRDLLRDYALTEECRQTAGSDPRHLLRGGLPAG